MAKSLKEKYEREIKEYRVIVADLCIKLRESSNEFTELFLENEGLRKQLKDLSDQYLIDHKIIMEGTILNRKTISKQEAKEMFPDNGDEDG